MLFEDVILFRRVQPPDIVPLKPAVSNRVYLEADGIDSEMIGDLVDYGGKISGQG